MTPRARDSVGVENFSGRRVREGSEDLQRLSEAFEAELGHRMAPHLALPLRPTERRGIDDINDAAGALSRHELCSLFRDTKGR